jgi:small subunit ribosomal protein S9
MNILARGVGRRKEAVAQVQIVKATNEAPGGKFVINNIAAEHYLHNNTCSILSIKAPLTILQSLNDVNIEGENTDKTLEMNTGLLSNFNTIVKVKGGGLVGQAEAIKLGLTRAICQLYDITPSNLNKPIREYSSNENSIEEASTVLTNVMGYEATVELRKQYKDKGFLTQDSRVKERRKYGLKKARKASQYHKR